VEREEERAEPERAGILASGGFQVGSMAYGERFQPNVAAANRWTQGDAT